MHLSPRMPFGGGRSNVLIEVIGFGSTPPTLVTKWIKNLFNQLSGSQKHSAQGEGPGGGLPWGVPCQLRCFPNTSLFCLLFVAARLLWICCLFGHDACCWFVFLGFLLLGLSFHHHQRWPSLHFHRSSGLVRDCCFASRSSRPLDSLFRVLSSRSWTCS